LNRVILPALLLGIAALAGLSAWLYWHLIVAEGALVGQWLVTLLYDLAAWRYDHIKSYSIEAEDIFLGGPIAKLLANRASPLIVDIGTGTGRLPAALLARPDFHGQIIGVDASLAMLRIAARKRLGGSGRVVYVWQDASCLPFEDAIFDCVTCLEMLEFTPSPADQLTEAVRVLAPGGLLVVTRRRNIRYGLMPGKLHSIDEFEALLSKAGLVGVTRHVWQVDYDLYYAWRASSGHQPVSGQLQEAIRCPACGVRSWLVNPGFWKCQRCGAQIREQAGILHLARYR